MGGPKKYDSPTAEFLLALIGEPAGWGFPLLCLPGASPAGQSGGALSALIFTFGSHYLESLTDRFEHALLVGGIG